MTSLSASVSASESVSTPAPTLASYEATGANYCAEGALPRVAISAVTAHRYRGSAGQQRTADTGDYLHWIVQGDKK